MNKFLLGKTYYLDLGASAPVKLKSIELLDKDSVLCEYLNSYQGRVEVLPLKLFKLNGYG